MIVFDGEIYFERNHVEVIKQEPEYVKTRYRAIVRTLISDPFRITREKAAKLVGVCLRQFYRIINRYRAEGINGLRYRSRCPKTHPNITPVDIEEKVLAVRWNTGLGPKPIANIVNESLKRENRDKRLYSSVTYNILRRYGEVKEEKRFQQEWKFFEWGHPNRLIQADLTKLNGVNILTMLDDHSRKGWSLALKNAEEETVTNGMKKLIKRKYDNLLTDNGSQFSRKNANIRKYCEEFVNEKHIWTSVHHPQTMGKLSAYQKGLKRFLKHRVFKSRNRRKMNHWIKVYDNWYNNGKYHSRIGTVPEMRYSKKVDASWYEKLVKALKLETVLTI
jgi:hypothetical protein